MNCSNRQLFLMLVFSRMVTLLCSVLHPSALSAGSFTLHPAPLCPYRNADITDSGGCERSGGGL